MSDFVIEIPADATWEPMEMSDVLEKDGVYCGVITGEKVHEKDGKSSLILTITLSDDDVKGRKVTKFMPDPRANPKVMFLWRGLARSIAGIETARQGFSYRPGAFTNQTCYFKVESFQNDSGERSSGVADWKTKDEYDAAVKAGAHRWAAKAPASRPSGAPTGLPAAFPGMPGAPALSTPPAPPAMQPMAAPAPVAAAALAPPAPTTVAPPAPAAAPAPFGAFAFPKK